LESHISDETALQLLKLTDEGVNLQTLDKTTRMGGNFLENFRKRMYREGLVSLWRIYPKRNVILAVLGISAAYFQVDQGRSIQEVDSSAVHGLVAFREIE